MGSELDTRGKRQELWTQKEAAAALRVSVSYLRASNCPKLFLPSLRPGGRPLLRYDPEQLLAWARRHDEFYR